MREMTYVKMSTNFLDIIYILIVCFEAFFCSNIQTAVADTGVNYTYNNSDNCGTYHRFKIAELFLEDKSGIVSFSSTRAMKTTRALWEVFV